MATLNFPDAPNVGDVFEASSQGGIFSNSTQYWTWNGSYWEAASTELVVGPTGPTGPQGSAGTNINFKGSVTDIAHLPADALLNHAYINDDDGNLYVFNGSDWTDAGQIVGPQGVQGPTGPTGPQGDQGAGGNPGQIGPTGATGATGPTGADGADGIPGVKGDRGDAGPTGPTGADGVDGADGADSTIAIGTVSTGNPGSSASVVNSGTASNAVLEITIPRGDTGPQGDTGPAGADGVNGLDGASFNLLGSFTTSEYNLAALANEAGTAYLVDGHLYFWNTVSETYDDLGSLIGPTGATGATGPQGTDIHFAGSVADVASLPSGAAKNDAYIVDADGNLWVSDGAENWTDAGQIVGPLGPTGPQGDTGPAGTYTAGNNISIVNDTISLADNVTFTVATGYSMNADWASLLNLSVTNTISGTANNASHIDGHAVFVQKTAPTSGMADGDIWIKRP